MAYQKIIPPKTTPDSAAGSITTSKSTQFVIVTHCTFLLGLRSSFSRVRACNDKRQKIRWSARR